MLRLSLYCPSLLLIYSFIYSFTSQVRCLPCKGCQKYANYYHKGSASGIINLGIKGALQLGRGSNLVQGLGVVLDVSWSQFLSSHLICEHIYFSFGMIKITAYVIAKVLYKSHSVSSFRSSCFTLT